MSSNFTIICITTAINLCFNDIRTKLLKQVSLSPNSSVELMSQNVICDEEEFIYNDVNCVYLLLKYKESKVYLHAIIEFFPHANKKAIRKYAELMVFDCISQFKEMTSNTKEFAYIVASMIYEIITDPWNAMDEGLILKPYIDN